MCFIDKANFLNFHKFRGSIHAGLSISVSSWMFYLLIQQEFLAYPKLKISSISEIFPALISKRFLNRNSAIFIAHVLFCIRVPKVIQIKKHVFIPRF